MNKPDKIHRTRSNVEELVELARQTQQDYERYDQETVDEVVTAIAWAVIKPEHNQLLSEMAVKDTGLGRIEDKIDKNYRKTMGLLRDLRTASSVGVIREYPDKGIVEIARPVGVVGAITPSTNPVATPTNIVMNALKGRNAVVLSPSPKGYGTAAKLVEFFRKALRRVKASPDLIQLLREPINKEVTRELMQCVDLVVATGSESNVRAAYKSGTPAIGASKGNAPVIVDTSADLPDAASKIARSKTFDHATSCSSENSLILLRDIYKEMICELEKEGGVLLTQEEKKQLECSLWSRGQLNREIVARSVAQICKMAQLKREEVVNASFLMVEEQGVGKNYPFSGEKLSPVLTLCRASTFDDAVRLVEKTLSYQGLGHSCGIHTRDDQQILRLGLEVSVCRIIVNQSHCFANGGNFDNGLPFSLSMGCGTWGRDSTHDNLNYRHYLNITKISRVIPRVEPSEVELFGAFHEKHGR